MSDIKRPVLRYHGGKFLLAKWIISHFPPHRIYVEGFGGAGSILMQKERSFAEVYNDKWDTVVNVFQVLRNPESAKELERVLRLTPYSRAEFLRTGEIDLRDVISPIEKARLTIFRSFAGFGSASTNNLHATGFRPTCKLNSVPVHSWATYPDHIAGFTERLKGVVIENIDYRRLIGQHDSPETLFFLDPPYVHETRNMRRGNAAYVHEMTDQDHVDMGAALEGIVGMAIVAGYPSGLYNDVFKDWVRVDRKALADGAAPRVECLWINQAAASKLNKTLFDHADPDLSFGGPEY